MRAHARSTQIENRKSKICNSSFLPAAKRRGHPFFRSYGARLPSSLTRFHSRALAKFCPPTCVGLRYGQPWEHLVAFLDTSFNRSGSAEASPSPALRRGPSLSIDGLSPLICHN